jgi:hypothetical protein
MAATEEVAGGRRSSPVGWVLVVLLLTLGAWPFVPYLTSVPLQPDSLTWIERSQPGAEGWSEWVFRSSHFVGYRPLTALSFAADVQLFGLSSLALRLTDLAFHLGAGAALFLLARRLVGLWPAGLALAVFLAHPGADEVVPFLARRSYSIATLGGMLGLLLASRAVSTRGPLRGQAGDGPGSSVAFALTGPTLLLAMFGNELGALLALSLPIVALGSMGPGGGPRAALVSAWGWLWIAAGVVIRHQVMEGGGGYDHEGSLLDRGAAVLTLYGAALPGRLQGAEGGWGLAAVGVGAYYLVAAILLLRGPRRTIVPLGLLCTLTAFGVTVASQGVWFPRQVYPATAVLALLAAVVASRTVFDARTGRGQRWAHGAGLGLLLAVLLHDSPLIVGPSPGRVRMAEVATGFVGDVQASTVALEPPARVFVVAPTVAEPELDRAFLRADWGPRPSRALERRIQVPVRWLAVADEDRGVRFRELAYVMGADGLSAPSVQTTPALEVRLPEGATCYDASGRGMIEMPPGQRAIRGQAIKRRGAPAYVWTYSAQGGALTPVAAPARRAR